MGNQNNNISSPKTETQTQNDYNDNDDNDSKNVSGVNNRMRIIDNKKIADHHDNNSKKSKSFFGGIKDYFMGTTNINTNEDDVNQYHSKYTNTAVFVKLSAPNYYFANQGLQWVEETMIYDEEGDGYHICIGPLS